MLSLLKDILNNPFFLHFIFSNFKNFIKRTIASNKKNNKNYYHFLLLSLFNEYIKNINELIIL